MDIYETVLRLFEEEADQASVPLSSVDLDPFVRTMAFALKVGSSTGTAEDMMPGLPALPQTTDAVASATQFRNTLGANDLDALYELPALVDHVLGVTVFVIEQRWISGACAVVDGRAFIFISEFSGIDALYICARQLGHLLVLPKREKRVVIELAHEPSHAPKGPYKRFADYFALELLIPTRGLATALAEVRRLLNVTNPSIGDIELLYLSHIFGVSFLSLARRCEREALLPRGGAAAFYQILVEQHGGPEKRASAAMLPPRPDITIPRISHSLATQIGAQIRSGNLSRQEAKHELNLSSPHFEQILGLH
jgi:Zn-dependent peptidase ImmA (M78 family)